MIKGNIRRSEKRLRIMLKTGLCLAALTGAYVYGPTAYDKIKAVHQEKLVQERMQAEQKLVQQRAVEAKMRHHFDCELIKEIHDVEKSGMVRYFSADTAFMNLMQKDQEAFNKGQMSQTEYQIRAEQYKKRYAQMKQFNIHQLLKKGEHPLIEMMNTQRQPANVVTQTVQNAHWQRVR